MDATAAVVILLFVVSIFSSFGNNKGFNPPAPPAGTIYSEVNTPEPEPTYLEVVTGGGTRVAIQRFILHYRPTGEAEEITGYLMDYSQKYNVNPKLVAALMARESRFNPRATSSSGAMGLGQLLPSTAENMGITNGYDIEQNTYGTVRYFRYLVDRFNGDLSQAIASYLEGPNAVTRQGGFSYHTKTYVEDVLTVYQQI